MRKNAVRIFGAMHDYRDTKCCAKDYFVHRNVAESYKINFQTVEDGPKLFVKLLSI